MLAPNLNQPIYLSGDPERGMATDFDLRTGAVGQALLIYTGRYAITLPELEVRCEIYEIGNKRSIHTMCIRCGQSIMVHTGGDITIEYERNPNHHGLGAPETFYRLYVSAFECPYELEERRMEFGVGLCRAKVEYAGQTIRDA